MINNTTKSLTALSITPYFGNIRFVKARENNFDFIKLLSRQVNT